MNTAEHIRQEINRTIAAGTRGPQPGEDWHYGTSQDRAYTDGWHAGLRGDPTLPKNGMPEFFTMGWRDAQRRRELAAFATTPAPAPRTPEPDTSPTPSSVSEAATRAPARPAAHAPA